VRSVSFKDTKTLPHATMLYAKWVVVSHAGVLLVAWALLGVELRVAVAGVCASLAVELGRALQWWWEHGRVREHLQ